MGLISTVPVNNTGCFHFIRLVLGLFALHNLFFFFFRCNFPWPPALSLYPFNETAFETRNGVVFLSSTLFAMGFGLVGWVSDLSRMHGVLFLSIIWDRWEFVPFALGYNMRRQ